MKARRLGGGERPPVLLLHGFTGSSRSWPTPLLNELSRKRPVLAVDLPGHGDSPAPSPSDRSFPDTLDALVRLLDAEGMACADWIGYSMGGRIALAGALTYPDRVRRLVLESASPGLATPRARELRRSRDEALARRIEEGSMASFVDFWMELPLFASQKRLPEAVRHAGREARLRQAPRALAESLRALGTGTQPSYWPHLTRFPKPVLLLTGALDRKFEEMADRMGEALPAARRRTVPEVGHAVHLEAPAAWLEAVIPFLDGR